MSSTERLQVVADSTTPQDIDAIHAAIASIRDPFALSVIHLVKDVWHEWNRSGRCGVCGMTSKQAADAGYDCTREC